MATEVLVPIPEGENVKSKLLVLAFLAGGSMFAESRFSVRIGVGDGGYYAPSYGYGQPGYYRAYPGSYGYGGPAYGYRSYDPERAHERAERRALRQHQREERWQYGDSEELREHQIQERRDLEHEQWHERHGDHGAAYGPGHESAYDGYR